MNDKSSRAWLLLLLAMLLAFGALSALVVHQSELNTIDVLEDSLLVGGERLGNSLLPYLREQPPPPPTRAFLANQLSVASASLGCRIRILDSQGRILADSQPELQASDQLRQRPEVQAALAGNYEPFLGSGHERRMSPGIFVAVPIKDARKMVVAVVYLSHSTANLQSELEPIRWFALKGLLVLALGVILWAGWLTGRWRSLKLQLRRTHQQVVQRVPVPLVEGQDITPLAESFNELLGELQDKITLLEAEKLKNKRFLQDLAHYLKTPLTGMAGSIEAVQGVQLADPALNRLLQRVGSETSRLSRLVSQLLALEKVGNTTLRIEPFELGSLLEVTLGHFESIAATRNIQLVWEEESLAVLGDVEQIRAVVQNLLDNAVRCSPDGGTVTVRCYSGDGCARVEIMDQGPGVRPDEQEAIFERFSGGRASGGSMGLGLAIARGVLSAHGQTIQVTNQPSGGACFSFTLALVRGTGSTIP